MGFLEGKTAVITGAARGIGAAIAFRLAREGATIAIVDIGDASQSLADIREVGVDCAAFPIDVSDPAAVERLREELTARLGAPSVLVNNAALHPHPTAFADLTFDYWRRTMAVNLDSVFLMTKAFLPAMRTAGWGRIVNVSSAAYNAAPPNGAPYIASKGGVVGLTRAVATEAGADGVTCNAIAPNPVRTPGADGSVTEEMFRMIAATQPVNKVMEPRDVAGVVAFLCRQEAGFMTGQHLHIDGGAVRGD